MKQTKIKGYKVAVIIEEVGGLYYASAPGIGLVYIEEKSLEKALELAKDAVISIIDARSAVGEEITEGNEYLEVIRDTEFDESVFCRSVFSIPFNLSRKNPRAQKRTISTRR